MSKISVKREGLLYCLVGPTASGKSSLSRELLARDENIHLSISATTRAPRAGEQDGVHYHFIERAEFERQVKEGLFFEWAEVHGNLYGTTRQTVNEAISAGKDLLLDIDIKGVRSFKAAYPNNTIVCVVTPPDRATLLQRISARSQVIQSDLDRRLATAVQEYQEFRELAQTGQIVDYLLVNENFETSFEAVRALLIAERLNIARMSQETLAKIFNLGG